jgi:hypothetical protein
MGSSQAGEGAKQSFYSLSISQWGRQVEEAFWWAAKVYLCKVYLFM